LIAKGKWFAGLKLSIMKNLFLFVVVLLITACVIFISCNKERSCEGCNENNKPPIAVAGPNQVITLPTDSVSLDGNASSDPDGTIGEWFWAKISGPASFNIVNASVAKSIIKNLATGTYQFELTVKDNGGLSAKDTMQGLVSGTTPTNQPPIHGRFLPFHVKARSRWQV
jgi:K319L-like, PKD domain